MRLIKGDVNRFLMKIRGNHIQFTVSGEKHRYWSPHLTIELEDLDGSDKQGTHIRGLFGPAQTLWTFFLYFCILSWQVSFNFFNVCVYQFYSKNQ